MDPVSGATISNSASNFSLPRHRWYEFKEGFSETLVRAAADASSAKRPKLLDPFSGGGTTAVTAGRMGLAATAIEVNPFAAFASRAKCAPRLKDLRRTEAALQRLLDNTPFEIQSPLEGISTFTQSNLSAEKWLFNTSVLRGFHALDLRLKIERGLRDPLRLALFSALMECCNARRDGKCLRYRARWKTKGTDSETLRAAFSQRARIVLKDLAVDDFDEKRITLVEGDCRQELSKLRTGAFDILVTSPPYLNSFDYSDVYRPELFAGGFVRSNAELRRVRLSAVRSHVQAAWKAAGYCPSPAVGAIFKALLETSLWNKRIPHMVRSYFVDLRKVLAEAFRLVKPGGAAYVVVSTSAYGGIEICVHELLADIAERIGWQVKEITLLRKLRASGQHFGRLIANTGAPLRESLIILSRK